MKMPNRDETGTELRSLLENAVTGRRYEREQLLGGLLVVRRRFGLGEFLVA